MNTGEAFYGIRGGGLPTSWCETGVGVVLGASVARLEFRAHTKSRSYTLTQTSSSQFQPVEPTVLCLLVYPFLQSRIAISLQ